MSPRKTILRALARAHDEHGAGTFTRPSTIAGFEQRPERFQKAVNELLQARLVEGRQDEEGRMTIAVNAHRLREIRRAIRPAWAHPAVWALVAVAIAVGAGFAFLGSSGAA